MRRELRQNYDVLKYGKFIGLIADSDVGIEKKVLAFARTYHERLAIIAINFSPKPVRVYLNLKNLTDLFENYEESDLVARVENWNEDGNETYDYYSIQQFLNDRHYAQISSYNTLMWRVTILRETPEVQKELIDRSIKRIKVKLENGYSIHYNDISYMLVKVLTVTNSFQSFVNGFTWFYENILKKYSIPFSRLISLTKPIMEETRISARLFAFFRILKEKEKELSQLLDYYPIIDDLIHYEKVESIVFVSNEIAPWTNIGGIGVMISRLAEELVKLGEEVVIITPYYYWNRHGEIDYLDKNPNFQKDCDMCVQLGKIKQNVQIYYGSIKGVKYYFIQQNDLFSKIFLDYTTNQTLSLRKICVFAKATLEIIKSKINPGIVVSNDWMSSLIPVFAKSEFYHSSFEVSFL